MNIAVGIACLVVVTLLAGVHGFSEDPELKKYQSERHDPDCRRSRGCKILGGVCQPITEKCDGELHTGRIFCRKPVFCGCCVPPPPSGCLFGDTVYSNGDFLFEETCMMLQCIDGTWNYTGIIDPNCRECQVWGEPHFITFDRHPTFLNHGWGNYYYAFQGLGDYVITQRDLHIIPEAEFGLSATFVYNYNWTKSYTSVRSINYHELGINVNITLPPPNPDGSPNGAIKVFVNGQEVTIGKSLNTFYATGGPVFIFEHYHYGNADNPGNYSDASCMNLVGSKGLSMSLCMADYTYYSNLYVWATQSLRHSPSQLYGLCGTYTGEVQHGYTMSNGSKTNDTYGFAHSWQITNNDINIPPNLTKCTNVTELKEVQDECNGIISGVCKVSTISQCDAFNASCIYDLCRMPNRYAEGYAFHMQIHSHLAQ